MEQVQLLTDTNSGALFMAAPCDPFQFLPFAKGRAIAPAMDGKVFLVTVLATQRKPQLVAKTFDYCQNDEAKTSQVWLRFLKETALLQKLNHQNIAKMNASISCPDFGLILMDYYPDGDLLKRLPSLTEPETIRFFFQISSAVRYMHSKNVIHRDIKLANIFTRNNDAYLADFGISLQLEKGSPMVSGYVGTSLYIAPEVEPGGVKYDGYKADLYSIGVVLWCMMLKRVPEDETDFLSDLKLEEQKLNPVLFDCARFLLREDPDDRCDGSAKPRKLESGLSPEECVRIVD